MTTLRTGPTALDLPLGLWSLLPRSARAELSITRGTHTCHVTVLAPSLRLEHHAPGALVLVSALPLAGLPCTSTDHPTADGLVVPLGAPVLELVAGHCVLTSTVLVAPCVMTVGTVELSGPVALTTDGCLDIDLSAAVHLGRGGFMPPGLREDALTLRVRGTLRCAS